MTTNPMTRAIRDAFVNELENMRLEAATSVNPDHPRMMIQRMAEIADEIESHSLADPVQNEKMVIVAHKLRLRAEELRAKYL